jgi:hypothetical protein
MIDVKDTFDTSTALSSMYLWLLFGYLSSMINCDLQRIIKKSQLVRHLVALVAFYFLFTIIDGNNKTNMMTIWVKTLVVYLLFVLTTKSKWYFALPTLGLLLVDQSIKKHVTLSKAQDKLNESDEIRWLSISRLLNIVVTTIIVIGCIHYGILQFQQHRADFSWYKFVFGTASCKQE